MAVTIESRGDYGWLEDGMSPDQHCDYCLAVCGLALGEQRAVLACRWETEMTYVDWHVLFSPLVPG